MKFNKNKANKIRDQIQDKAVNYSYKNSKLLLSWCTGAGKTLAALKIIDKHFGNDNNKKGYLICKEQTHISNWNEDIIKHNKDHLYSSMSVFLYASAHKYTKNKVDFLILDECHAITDKRLNYIYEMINKDTFIIMLSATVEPEKKILLEYLAPKFLEYNITLSEAIEIGLLPPPTIYIHRFKLDNKIKNLKFINTKKEIIKCTEQIYYNLISKKINAFKKIYFLNKQIWAKNKWLNKASERKRFISNIKSNRAKYIIKKYLNGYRYIVFTGTKNQCEYLSPTQFIHSGKNKEEILIMKDDFNNKKTNELYVVNMFKEGINLVDTEKGLIIQLDNKELSLIQRLGRLFRSEFPEIHIIIMSGTQDEIYFNNVFKDFDKNYINLINY